MPDNDIPVADGSVSRRHCAIVVHATRGCEVYDTASKNGTYVNGQRINGLTALKAGDQIRLCDRQFRLRLPARRRPTRTTPALTSILIC